VVNDHSDGVPIPRDAMWTATLPESGRFDPIARRSSIDVLASRFAELRARGEGYLEVKRIEDSPRLTVGFRGSIAVVQMFDELGATSILKGDGSSPTELIEVPIMDDAADFSGKAGLSVDRAWSIVLAFLQRRDLSELGEWVDL